METNMKAADELLTIRNRIKELQAREKEIKAGMETGEIDQVGDFAICRFVQRKSKRFDRKAAEDELGSLARFEKHSLTNALMVEELVLDDA